MFKGKRVLGIIPARGGSKGLPGKNVMPLFGKPLIAWTIQNALESRCLDRVVVSTDSKEIARISAAHGAEVPFLRPKRLAADGSKVIDTIFHALDHFKKGGERFDCVALLEPTSPLRRKGEIDRAVRLLVGAGGRADCVISLGEIALEHPAYAKKKDAHGLVSSFFANSNSSALRQALPKAYFPYGVVYLSTVESLRRTKNVYAGRILLLQLERWQNYEINDIFDFRCVEAILRERGVAR